MKFTLSHIILKEIIESICEQSTALAESHKINLKTKINIGPELEVQLDEKLFRGILLSIIENAFKFSNKNSIVQLQVEIDTSKSGIILSAMVEEMAVSKMEITKIFSSEESNTTDTGAGNDMGMSLMLARHICQIMGGNITVENTNENGLTFLLFWPLNGLSGDLSESYEADNQTELVNSEPSKRNLSHHSKSTVLLVEDQAEMLEYTSELLSNYYQVITAMNGEEAWQILKNTNSTIDLVVTDLMMPVMDGFELLEKIRADEQLMNTSVALLTGRKGDENIIRALSVGVSDYITKPFTKEILLAHCKHLLSNTANKQKPSKAEVSDETEETGNLLNETLKLVDLNWLNNVEKVFRTHMKNKYFNMVVLANELAISERQMRRKLKKITGMSPVQYMNEIKLNNARQMLLSEKYATVAEVSYEVGFETPKYFSALFKDRYGVNPSELL